MKKGFTLAEILIVIGIMTIVLAITLPLYIYFQNFSVIDSIKTEILQNVRAQQVKARAGKSDSNFGVIFDTNQYTLYQGDSYATREQVQDQIFSMPDYITLTGLSEINFTNGTGLSNNVGTVTITNINSGAIEIITINSAGFIQ